MTQAPRKPALPILLIPLPCCWAGIVCAAELNYQAESLLIPLPFLVAIALFVVLLVVFKKTQKISIPLLSMLVFVLAFGSGNLSYQRISNSMQTAKEITGIQSLIVVEDARTTQNSQTTEVILTSKTGEQLRLRAFWNDAELRLPKGTTIEAHCRVSPLKEDQKWLYEKGVVANLSLSAIEDKGFPSTLWGRVDSFRESNVTRIKSLAEKSEGTALLLGVLLGYRTALQDGDLEQDFISCGLSHLIAVSGSHLAVVAALFGWMLKRLPLRALSETVILLLVLGAYVMLTGLQPSAVRSAIMAGVAGCSVLVGRRGHAPSALSAAAIAMLLIHPPNAYSVGFWLSVLAVFGITLFVNLVAQWLSSATAKKHTVSSATQDKGAREVKDLSLSKQGTFTPQVKTPGALATALALTLTASSATAPLAVPVFSVLSLVGPLANVLVAPLVSFMLVLGMLALLAWPVFEFLGTILMMLALGIAECAAVLASLLSKLPFAAIPLALPEGLSLVVGILAAAFLYVLWPLPQPRTLRLIATTFVCLVCVVGLLPAHFKTPQLTVMDIGQGDALLVREQDKNILIDTGASETLLVKALARNHIYQLDAVIITHLDSDHAGALKRLRGLVAVDSVYFAQGLLTSQAHNAYIQDAYKLVGEQGVKELKQGDRIPLGSSLYLDVLWPSKPVHAGTNEESVCLLLCYDAEGDATIEQRALLTGDAEEHEIQQILSDYKGLTAELIKIGHHGSKGAITSDQLSALSSICACISVGADNQFGHPSPEVLATLEQAEVQVYRTDQQGDIQCEFRGSTLKVSCATIGKELY